MRANKTFTALSTSPYKSKWLSSNVFIKITYIQFLLSDLTIDYCFVNTYIFYSPNLDLNRKQTKIGTFKYYRRVSDKIENTVL